MRVIKIIAQLEKKSKSPKTSSSPDELPKILTAYSPKNNLTFLSVEFLLNGTPIERVLELGPILTKRLQNPQTAKSRPFKR